jgi:hypothetical protein
MANWASPRSPLEGWGVPIKANPPRTPRRGSNATGTFQTTAERDYAAYDRLPPRVKRMLMTAPLDFAAEAVYARWQQARAMMWTDAEFAMWLDRAIKVEYAALVRKSWNRR